MSRRASADSTLSSIPLLSSPTGAKRKESTRTCVRSRKQRMSLDAPRFLGWLSSPISKPRAPIRARGDLSGTLEPSEAEQVLTSSETTYWLLAARRITARSDGAGGRPRPGRNVAPLGGARRSPERPQVLLRRHVRGARHPKSTSCRRTRHRCALARARRRVRPQVRSASPRSRRPADDRDRHARLRR